MAGALLHAERATAPAASKLAAAADRLRFTLVVSLRQQILVPRRHLLRLTAVAARANKVEMNRADLSDERLVSWLWDPRVAVVAGERAVSSGRRMRRAGAVVGFPQAIRVVVR
ncbi:hypothetical protein MSAS_44790 [Mycobacterium saskatchewanense]|nr:hypothetical protein MSAS_44790 [Mycobacterium saskatchewanense]